MEGGEKMSGPHILNRVIEDCPHEKSLSDLQEAVKNLLATTAPNRGGFNFYKAWDELLIAYKKTITPPKG